KTTAVCGPSSGAALPAKASSALAFRVTNTTSCGPSSAARSAARTLPRMVSSPCSSVTPLSRIAARWAPRATTDTSSPERAASIQQSANSVKVLYDLGLRDAIERVAVKPRDYEFRRFDTGELLHRIPFAEAHEKAHGAPYYHLHRADFHKILADKVMAMDPHC